jgi:mannose-6-phosphate isomerase-like protein (cupin superfamily)
LKVSSIESTAELEVFHNPKIKKHELLSRGDIEQVTIFSRAIFPPGETACTHSHADMTEVFYVESGQGVISVNEKLVTLKAGTCVVVEPNENHELKNIGSTDMVVLYFGIKTQLEN